MSDVIIIEYQGDVTKLSAALDKLEAKLLETSDTAKAASNGITKAYQQPLGIIEKERKQLELLQRSRDKSNDPKAIQVYNNLITQQNAKLKSLTSATEVQTQKVVTLNDKLSNLANSLPFANQIKEVTALGSAVTESGGAAQKSSLGFQILKVAIASTGIGLLIIAIIGLIAYFKRTDEGATKLEGVMGALGAATDLVTGFVVQFGEATFSALQSVAGLKQGLLELGEFLLNNLLNRIKAFMVAFESLQLAIGGDFKAATLKFLDATAQFASGITDVTSKAGAFADKAAKAAAEAFDWALRMDALNDKIREDSTVIAENDRAITRLIIQSKNKNIADEKSLEFLNQASQLEKRNLAITLQNEEAKLKLIQERNRREAESINQDIAAGQKRRNINDNLAQEERDQINKIVQLKQSSDNLIEKIDNRRDNKLEEIFQNSLKRLQLQETEQENFAKAEFNQNITNAEQLEQELYNVKLQGLRNQKQLLVDNGRDTIEIDKAIIDLQLAAKIKGLKEQEALQKEADKKAQEEENDRLKKEAAYKAEFDRKQEAAEKAHQEKIKFIKQSSVGLAQDLAQGLLQANAQRRQNELQGEIDSAQEETNAKIALLQKQKDQGLISQEDFDKQSAALQKKQHDREVKIKRDQFIADRNAKLVSVAIDTAAAVVKTLATLGVPAGLAAAAIAIATGAVQAAIIVAQPIPKFAKGGIRIDGPGSGTSDSITAKLSRGESVMTADETNRYEGSLLAMRNNDYDKYIHKNYVVPAMEKMQRSAVSRREALERTQSEIARSLQAGASMDTSHMERLIKNNKNVNINNASQIAEEIAKRINTDSGYIK